MSSLLNLVNETLDFVNHSSAILTLVEDALEQYGQSVMTDIGVEATVADFYMAWINQSSRPSLLARLSMEVDIICCFDPWAGYSCDRCEHLSSIYPTWDSTALEPFLSFKELDISIPKYYCLECGLGKYDPREWVYCEAYEMLGQLERTFEVIKDNKEQPRVVCGNNDGNYRRDMTPSSNSEYYSD